MQSISPHPVPRWGTAKGDGLSSNLRKLQEIYDLCWPHRTFFYSRSMVKLAVSTILLLMMSWLSATAMPADYADSVRQRSLQRFWIIGGIGYGVAHAGLYAAWYNEQATRQFQFFNDGAQWKQVDKVGHFYSAFHLSWASTWAFRRAGLAQGKSHSYGSLTGWLLLLPVEVFDGFSQAYGFSWQDVAANAAGAAFLLSQHTLWKEVRIWPKFSFHRTALAPERPNTLGSNLPEEILKDYNGQTYWLSVDLHSFLKKSYPRFPKWLNVAVGYGAHQMLHARHGANQAAGYAAYREFYLALDLDLHYYRKPPVTFGNKLWNGLLYTVNLIHLPTPALSYQPRRGFIVYPLYF